MGEKNTFVQEMVAQEERAWKGTGVGVQYLAPLLPLSPFWSLSLANSIWTMPKGANSSQGVTVRGPSRKANSISVVVCNLANIRELHFLPEQRLHCVS